MFKLFRTNASNYLERQAWLVFFFVMLDASKSPLALKRSWCSRSVGLFQKTMKRWLFYVVSRLFCEHLVHNIYFKFCWTCEAMFLSWLLAHLDLHMTTQDLDINEQMEPRKKHITLQFWSPSLNGALGPKSAYSNWWSWTQRKIADLGSAEQITSLYAFFKSGWTPYVDMAIWGPFQHRIRRKIKMKGVRFNSTGEIMPIELYRSRQEKTISHFSERLAAQLLGHMFLVLLLNMFGKKWISLARGKMDMTHTLKTTLKKPALDIPGWQYFAAWPCRSAKAWLFAMQHVMAGDPRVEASTWASVILEGNVCRFQDCKYAESPRRKITCS